ECSHRAAGPKRRLTSSPSPRKRGEVLDASAAASSRAAVEQSVKNVAAPESMRPSRMRPAGRPKPALGEADPNGFRAFAALGNVDHHALAFIEGRDPGSLEYRGVHESILPAFVADDEAKALLGIEPL